MPDNWKITAIGPKRVIQDALVAYENVPDWDPQTVLAGGKTSEAGADDWMLETWYPRRPTAQDKAAIAALFEGSVPALEVEQLADEDWLARSQLGIQPVHAGRYYVHTPEHPPSDMVGVRNLKIPANRAFGTGQHETTFGCLVLLSAMRRSGMIVRHVADIGTGTGLLSLAALDLWPRAKATASDIDPACIDVVEHNVAENGFSMGSSAGQLTMLVADGMDSQLHQARAPYDLLIANILAGPLIDLASSFGSHIAPGGNLLLAGLLKKQEPGVRRAFFRSGFRLARRMVRGDWVILWMRKRQFA